MPSTVARLTLVILALTVLLVAPSPTLAQAPAPDSRADTVLYSQPAASAGYFTSSHCTGPCLDNEQWRWDNFTLPVSSTITAVQWRGAYDPAKGGLAVGQVVKFDVQIWASVANQPDVTHTPLAQFQPTGSAGETAAGTFGGVPMYNYSFTLPTPFQAQAGTEYWLQIEGYQNTTIPDWAWTAGTGGDTRHFLRNNCNTGCTDHYASGDLAFTLLGTSSTTPPPPPPPPSGVTYYLYLPILRK